MHAYRDQYAKLFHDGRNVVLIAISKDPVDTLAAWAHDDQFQYLMASDPSLSVARRYGSLSTRGPFATRNLFVIGPDGRIKYREIPFRELDPTAYTDLSKAINAVTPAPSS